jgi:periplasmic copper chaperone A
MKQFIRTLCAMVAVGVLINGSVRANEIAAGDLVISQAWTRATPGGAKVAGAYMTIANKGTTPDRLIGASADFAEKAQLHEMTTKDGVMTMRPVDDGLVIDPGKTVKLAPGGYHLMLVGLKWPLRQGEKVAITLEFERAGPVGVPLDVEGLGAQGPLNPDN